MSVQVEISPALAPLLSVGVVEFDNLVVAPSSVELQQYSAEVAARARIKQDSPRYAEECQQIRQLLRYGKFKATGRSKPAQEYLMRCVLNDGALPCINAPVDLLNAVSLDFNLPISLLSIAKCSNRLRMDRGQSGESYAFNSAGQQLDLTDMITVYDDSRDPPRPVGTPVKDSMAGKIEPGDRHVVAIIYAPNVESALRRCETARQQLSEGFQKYCS